MIKISLLKLCDKSVWKTLDIIYKTRLKLIKFSPQWKKSNVVPVHKESDKETSKYYRPISLLPVWGKMFEGILYNNMTIFFFIEKSLIYLNQSGFRPGGIYINPILPINHEIVSAFDIGSEVRGIFLDMSKSLTKFGTQN